MTVRREAGLFLLNEASAPLRIKIYRRGTVIFDASGVGRGVKVRPLDGLDQVDIVNESGSAIDIEAFICAGDVDVQIATGLQVTVDNTAANPVPVDIQTPVTLTATSVEVNNTTANAVPVITNFASTIANGAAVACTAVEAAIVAASATRRGLRIKNAGVNPVAIGGTGIAYATAAVIIQAGETWNEPEAPGAAWFAICDTGLTSTLHVQTLE